MQWHKGKTQTLSFLPDGTVIDISDVNINVVGGERPDYLLSDSVDIDRPNARVLNIEVASTVPANYKLFSKLVGEAGRNIAGRTYVMPLWSFEELMAIKPSWMSEEEAKFRNQVYDSSARNFVSVRNSPCSILPCVKETMQLIFPDVHTAFPALWKSVAEEVSLTLYEKKEEPAREEGGFRLFNSMMRHITGGGTIEIWASKYMEFLAAAINDDREYSIWGELKRSIRSSGRGCWFEALGHRKLLNSTTKYLLKPLLPNKANTFPTTVPDFPEKTFNLPLVRVDTVESIARLDDDRYGLPISDQFPLVDAIIQPDILLQFTVVPSKHQASTEQLECIRNCLHEKDKSKHKMVFVIPQENIETFKYHSELSEINQYICLTILR